MLAELHSLLDRERFRTRHNVLLRSEPRGEDTAVIISRAGEPLAKWSSIGDTLVFNAICSEKEARPEKLACAVATTIT
jgi:hypothetical protein